MFDSTNENPELIWNDATRTRIKQLVEQGATDLYMEQIKNIDYKWNTSYLTIFYPCYFSYLFALMRESAHALKCLMKRNTGDLATQMLNSGMVEFLLEILKGEMNGTCRRIFSFKNILLPIHFWISLLQVILVNKRELSIDFSVVKHLWCLINPILIIVCIFPVSFHAIILIFTLHENVSFLYYTNHYLLIWQF
uniref:Uncharacterized protein n=1 Tax=Heterorhabditis bacteriophora TaxID=37862 RepID=A0A1I7WJ61_HETBA